MARTSRRVLRDNLAGWSFVLPAFLLLLAFMVYPIGHTLFLSFHKYNFVFDTHPTFAGLTNYVQALGSPVFRRAIINTLYFAALYIPIMFVLGFLVGLLFCQEYLLAGRVAKIVLFLPMVVPVSMFCYMFLFILNPQWGLLNSTLKDYLGLTSWARDWMNNPVTALNVILAVTVWQGIGFIGLLFMAGIQAVPESVLEAALIDGAGAFRRVVSVILPNLRPTYQLVGILTIITSIKLFGQVVAMTGVLSPSSAGGPANSTLTMYVATWKVAFHEFEMGAGSAMGYLISLIIVGLFAVNFAVNRVEKA